jgi:hypothetical protein
MKDVRAFGPIAPAIWRAIAEKRASFAPATSSTGIASSPSRS